MLVSSTVADQEVTVLWLPNGPTGSGATPISSTILDCLGSTKIGKLG